MFIFLTCDVSPFAGFAWFLARAVLNITHGLRLLISSLPSLTMRTLVESLSKPGDVNKRIQSLAW